MSFDTSTVYRNVLMIGGRGGKTSYRIKAELFTPDKSFYVFRVVKFNEFMDFVLNYAPETYLQLVMQPGVYNTEVLPNADKLNVNLYITTYRQYHEPEIRKLTFRCFPRTSENASVSQNSTKDLNTDAINETNLATYEFQVFDEALEKLRPLQTGGIFQMSTTASVLKVLLGGMSESLELPIERKPLGIEMTEPDTLVHKNHIIIQQGTKLVDLPKYLQDHYGIYNTDCGYFYYNQYWHIWPLYNTKRFELARKSLTIVNVPADRFPNIERTYELDGSSLSILSTGNIDVLDMNQMLKYNLGEGTRAIRASAMSGSEGTVTDKGVTVFQRAQSNTEVATSDTFAFKQVTPSTSEVTDNTCRILSRTAVTQGAIINLEWQNANPSLLVPDMPLKFLYLENGVVVQRYGTLLKWETLYGLATPGLAENILNCHAVLMIFVEPLPQSYNTSL